MRFRILGQLSNIAWKIEDVDLCANIREETCVSLMNEDDIPTSPVIAVSFRGRPIEEKSPAVIRALRNQ